MGGKADAPDPPDMEGLTAASRENAAMWQQVSMDQLAWAKDQDMFNRGLLERILAVQLPQMEQAFQNAQEDRLRYEEVFQPIEDQLVADLKQVGSPERQEAEAARRIADVRSQYDAQRNNATRALEDYGIDPSQTRHQALDLGFRAQEAATAAMAANQGRQAEEQMGRALRSEAINIGRGYPGQVAQSQGIVNQTAGGAMGNAAGTTGAGANAMSGAYGAGSLAQSGYGQTGALMNSGYNNRMTQYNANNANDQALFGALGAVGGSAAGSSGFWNMFSAEGGHVPDDLSSTPHPTDKIPAMLAKDEYVIPAHVVRAKGVEFFDKMLERYDKPKQGQEGALALGKSEPPVRGYAEGGAITPRCPEGYAWDERQQACVKIQQQQQANPAQAYQMYQQFAGAGAAPAASAPAASAPAAPATGAAAGAGGAGGASGAATGGMMAAAPWVAAAAAGSYWLDKANISSFKRQAKGHGMEDLLESPNFNNKLDNLGVPRDAIEGLKHFDAVGRLDFKDAYKHGAKPIKKAIDFAADLF